MNGMRILGAVCASILASSLGTLAACGGSPESKEASTSQAVSAASVSIALLDENGTRIGEGSGVLIAPRLVLTSGHLIAGKHKWVVTSADGTQQATGSRGMTYDWRKYDSNKAHPRRHDVGVIHLDDSIKLSAYPKLVGETTTDGAKATRIRANGGAFQQHDATLAKYRSSPNAWLADGVAGETLDTGGAVYDSRGILGIVSGRGMSTGKLYVARVDGLVNWLAPKVACAGGATGVRTYAGPAVDKSKEICEDAGTGASSSGGNGNESASGGGSSGGESGGSCDGNNDGVCSGNCANGGTNGSNGSNPGDSNPGGDGTPGSGGAGGSQNGTSGGSTSSNPGGSNPGDSNPGGDGTPGSSGGGGSAPGSSGGNTSANPGGSNPGGSNPGGDGTPSSSGGGGSQNGSSGGNGGSDGSEACRGPSDNPEVCPPEADGCTGSNCGGGQPDDTIDYGNCACGSGSGGGIYLR